MSAQYNAFKLLTGPRSNAALEVADQMLGAGAKLRLRHLPPHGGGRSPVPVCEDCRRRVVQEGGHLPVLLGLAEKKRVTVGILLWDNREGDGDELVVAVFCGQEEDDAAVVSLEVSSVHADDLDKTTGIIGQMLEKKRVRLRVSW